jgi:hypothetical protein
MNEEKTRRYAEYEALNEEYMALVPAVLTPLTPAIRSGHRAPHRPGC